MTSASDARSPEALPPAAGSRRLWALWYFEAAGALALLCNVALSRLATAYAATNQAPQWFRALAATLPWLGALLVVLATYRWVSKRSEQRVERVRGVARRATPLLVLWALPLLLDRDAFAERALFLMLVAAAAVLGLEKALAHASAGEEPHLLGQLFRAPALRRALPRALGAAAVLLTMGFLYFGSTRIHDKMLTSIYDFGLFENLFYNALHGRHGIALERPYFAEHAEFLLYALLPFYALVPASETLLALQAILMAGAAVPLFLLAERLLASSWAAALLAAAYLASPAIHGPAFYDFHFLPASAVFILWAAYFHVRRRGSWPFWLCTVLAMSCREDVALGVALVGLGGTWALGWKRLGVALFALGAAWFVVVKFLWMRQFGGPTFAGYYAELMPRDRGSFVEVLITVLSNPLFVLERLLTREKALLALQLLVPLAFLPVRHARTLFLLLPGLVVVGLAKSDSAIVQVHFHYATHFLPYLFIAAVAALAARPRAARVPTLAAVALGSVLVTLHFGAFFGSSFRTSFHEVSFGWGAEDVRQLEAFERLAAQIPADAAVAAGEYEGARLARRASLHALKLGVRDADFIIYSRRSLRWGGRNHITEALQSDQYGMIDSAGDLTLLGRNQPINRNREVLRALR